MQPTSARWFRKSLGSFKVLEQVKRFAHLETCTGRVAEAFTALVLLVRR